MYGVDSYWGGDGGTKNFIRILLLLCLCFTALRHISGHFGRSQLTYPHCSWASLLGSLPVLGAHSFASNWPLPFLNQQKGENGRRNYCRTSLHGRMLPDMRIEPATVRMPGGHASDWATMPGFIRKKKENNNQVLFYFIRWLWYHPWK